VVFLSLAALFLDSPHNSFRQYIRTIKEKKKQVSAIQKYMIEAEGHFCHLAPQLSEQEFRSILSQPFVFLAKGKQTEVYESLDGRYVLRCVKAKTNKKKSKIKIASLLRRALLAWNTIREETGLVAIALAPAGINLPPITLLTSKGALLSLSPEKTAFFLQKKAIPLKKALLQASHQKDLASMDALLASTFRLLASMRTAGVIDLDGALIRNGNLGVLHDQVILLDIGKIEKNQNKTSQTMKDIERVRPLYHWLFTFHKELVPSFLNYQERYQKTLPPPDGQKEKAY